VPCRRAGRDGEKGAGRRGSPRREGQSRASVPAEVCRRVSTGAGREGGRGEGGRAADDDSRRLGKEGRGGWARKERREARGMGSGG